MKNHIMKSMTRVFSVGVIMLFYGTLCTDPSIGFEFMEGICLGQYVDNKIGSVIRRRSKSGWERCGHCGKKDSSKDGWFEFRVILAALTTYIGHLIFDKPRVSRNGNKKHVREFKLRITQGRCPKCESADIIFWCSCSKTMRDKNRNDVIVEGIRISCNGCNRTTRCYPYGIKLWERLLPETYYYLVMQKMYKRPGYRSVGKEDYTSEGFSASTCWKAVQKLGPEAKKAMKEIPKEWSNIIIVDETYERCNGGTIIWIAASHFFKDKNGHHYSAIIKTKTLYVKATEESRIDKRKLNAQVRKALVKEIPVFFRELADSLDEPGKIKAVVTDLENLYPNAIADTFPNARHQFCLKHVYDAAKRAFQRDFGIKGLTKEDQEILSVLGRIPKIKSKDDYSEICGEFGRWWHKNEKRVKDAREKKGRTRGGIEWWYRRMLLKEENICAFIDIPGCPRTTNSLESQFSRLDQRTEVMKSFQSGEGAENYLDLAAVYLNVAPFVDGHNKGSSVIELAGIVWKQDIFP